VGLYASYYADVSSGAAIVLALSAVFVVAFLASARRRRAVVR
jgi:ABC-type Mn2+/Zn2+ transport system permease subunit